MKAIVVREFGKPEVMKLDANAPDPAVGPGDVLVRFRAAGVNPVDSYIHTGTHARKPTLPYTPGFDGAGEVERVGADVKDFASGDRVYIGGPPM
jgi:NADPH2:quinone reductase